MIDNAAIFTIFYNIRAIYRVQVNIRFTNKPAHLNTAQLTDKTRSD